MASRAHRTSIASAAFIIACLLRFSTDSRADLVSTVEVTYDTSAFAPGTVAQLYFQFTPKDQTTDSATVSLGSYSTSNVVFNTGTSGSDGTGSIANPKATDVNDLGLSVGNAYNANPANDAYFNLTFTSNSSSQIQFTLTFSGPAVNQTDSGYSNLIVQLVDPNNNYGSLTGASDLADITLNDSNTTAPIVTTTATGVSTSVQGPHTPTGTPEPSTLLAGCLCATALYLVHRRRAFRHGLSRHSSSGCP